MISLFLNQRKAPQGDEGFEACCQWALLTVQIVTSLFHFTVQKYMYPPVSKVHAGSFRVFVIHRTLTWTTGFLTCVRDHSFTCVYTRGLGTPTASQHNIFDSEKTHFFSCAPGGIRTSVLWILKPTLYPVSHPVTPPSHRSPPLPVRTPSLPSANAKTREEMARSRV